MEQSWNMTLQHLFSIMVTISFMLEVVRGASLPRSSNPAIIDQQRQFCDRGQYAEVIASGAVSCYPCPIEHFMDEDNHNNTECNRCTPKDEHITAETVIKDCTPESDRVIGCLDGYFFDWNHQCKECSRCERKEDTPYIGAPCSQEHNTICCPSPNMKVEWGNGSHSSLCVPGTTVTVQPTPTSQSCEGSVVRSNSCLQGEYVLRQCQTGDWVTCKPCAKNTFMNLSKHNESSCFPCSPPEESDLVIVHHCTPTRDNVYGRHASSTDTIIVASVLVVFVVVAIGVIIVYFRYCKSSQHPVVTEKWKAKLLAKKSKRRAESDTDQESDGYNSREL